jgi:DNA uptake protein ComE-like DNA-binding protein
MIRAIARLTLCLPLLAACGGGVVSDDSDPQGSSLDIGLTAADSQATLAFVNYPGTDATLLHASVGLDPRAATSITTWRAGPDGADLSADDRPFTSIAQLDAMPYVGDSALRKLQAYALAHPSPAPELVKGVHLAGWESQAIIWGVNSATAAVLDTFLDSRATKNLVAARPFASVAAMGAVAYVGSSALTTLHGQALGWWRAMRGQAATALAGTFDSVTFDEATAKTALDIANQATAAQLTAHGATNVAASHLIAGRPFTTLAQVAATTGIGTATLTALRSYAQSGQWGAPQCIATFEAAVSPHLADLLLMSESDRPFDLVSFPGAGTAAPTGASVLALVAAPAGSTAEVRPTDYYYSSFEPSSSAADPNAGGTVKAAFQAQLTDIIYVVIHAPEGSPDTSLVDSYLIGRTSCGDLVGLHAVAVET